MLQVGRVAVRDERGVATTLEFGPRFLRSTGQLHKGGPDTGRFLQIIDNSANPVPIPETDYNFAELVTAQAVGDYEALRSRGRAVLVVHLGDDRQLGLRTVSAALREAAGRQ